MFSSKVFHLKGMSKSSKISSYNQKRNSTRRVGEGENKRIDRAAARPALRYQYQLDEGKFTKMCGFKSRLRHLVEDQLFRRASGAFCGPV